MKKFLKGAATILTIAALPVAIAACNKTGETSQNPINPGGDPIEKTFTIDEIYNDMNVSLDVNQLLAEEAQQLADRAFGNGKEIVGFNVDDGSISVVAEVTSSSLGSVTATISTQTKPLLEGDVKSSAIERAGYTGDQEIAESQKAQAVENLTQAIEYIEQRICKISDGNINRVNYYPFEQTMQTGNLLCVFGPVRSDGTFVKLDVSENGEIVETVILVQGAKDMQPEEVYDAYQNGAEYVSSDPRIIDTSKAYTSPPTGQLQPDPDWGGSNPDDPTPGGDEETTTFEEIYNQVFGEGFVVNTNVDDIMTDLAERVFINTTDVSVVAVGLNDGFTIYSQNVDALGRTRLTEGVYKGQNLTEITNYLSLLQQIESAGGWESYINSFAPSAPVEEGSASYAQLIETLQSIKNNIENTDVLSTLTRDDFSTRTVINATRDTLPAPSNDFGEALMQDMGAEGTIIATYVGDMSRRLLDSANRFNTGYYTDYDLVIVYQTTEGIKITTAAIYNAWYTNSTNESLYANILNGTDDYQIVSTTTTTIENPTAAAAASSEAEFAIC